MRAAAIMSRTHPEQRRASRTHINVTGSVIYAGDRTPHMALTRDLGSGGVFFYCEHTPPLGARLTFTFVMPVLGRGVRVVAQGTVIRIERSPGGGASGIAAQFDNMQLPEAA